MEWTASEELKSLHNNILSVLFLFFFSNGLLLEGQSTDADSTADQNLAGSMCKSKRFRLVSFYLWFDCLAAIRQVQPFRCCFSLKVHFSEVRSGRKVLNVLSLPRNLGRHCWGSRDSINRRTQELWAIMQSPHWLQRVAGLRCICWQTAVADTQKHGRVSAFNCNCLAEWVLF